MTCPYGTTAATEPYSAAVTWLDSTGIENIG
jgi:hypothetical protein